MSVEKAVTDLPTVASAQLSDILVAVQGYIPGMPPTLGLSVQENLSQILALFQSNTILFNAGNPNGVLAGNTFQLCWDTTDQILYICTTTGTALTAVWTPVVDTAGGLINPVDGGTGVSDPAIHTLPVAQGASPFHFVGPLTNGQLLIGSTGADPVPASLMAGTNISITNAPGSILISSSGLPSIGWNAVSTPTPMVAGQGYVTESAGTVTLTLPTSAPFGTTIGIQGLGSGGTGGWTIAQNAGQQIHIGASVSSLGVAGSVSSTNTFNSLTLLCVVANTTFACLGGAQGNLTVV
jgi:hypothetical protein